MKNCFRFMFYVLFLVNKRVNIFNLFNLKEIYKLVSAHLTRLHCSESETGLFWGCFFSHTNVFLSRYELSNIFRVSY